MTKKCITWSLLFLFCFLHHRMAGQAEPAQLKRWVSSLSLKSDFRHNRFQEVFDDFIQLDSVIKCNVFDQLFQIGNQHNKRFLIRMHFLQGLMAAENLKCSDLKTGIAISQSGLDLAYELGDLYLIELGNKTLTGLYRLKEDYGMAIMHLRLVIEAHQELGPDNFYNTSFDLYVLGELSYHTRQYEDCIQYMNQALVMNNEMGTTRGDTINKATKMFLYNTLGLACLKTQKHDLAMDAFQEALRYARLIENHEWEFLIQGNMGDVFFDLGQYDTARVLLARDIQKSLAGGNRWLDNAANSLQKMARINIHENTINLARMQLRMADSLLAIKPKASISVQVYYGYLEMYKKLGLTDSLYLYSTKYVSLYDSLERKAANEQEEIVEVRLSNQENINKILSLTKDKNRITLIRNFIIVLTLLSAMIGLLYFNRQRLRMRLRHQLILDEKVKADNEARQSRSQLQVFTNHLLEKNNLVNSLQSQLMKKELTKEQVEYIHELSQHTILTDADWNHFKNLFEKVYPSFFLRLKNSAPDITLAELRIAALSKLEINAKEAAGLLGISPASVNKTRQRLRSRLGIESDAALNAYLLNP